MTLRTAACQAPLSVGFFGQEYWSGLPYLPPGDLPEPEIELGSPVSLALQAGCLRSEPVGKPFVNVLLPKTASSETGREGR